MRLGKLLGFAVPAALVAACGSAVSAGPGGECTPADAERAKEFAADAILKEAPGSQLPKQPNVVLPCEDDDSVGRVGQNFRLQEKEDVVRRYYLERSRETGWVLGKEHPLGYAEGPQICLTNEKHPDAQLMVFMKAVSGSTLDLFVEYHFGQPVKECH